MRKSFIAVAVAALAATGLATASAQVPPPTLTGSNFEIDTDANLIADLGGVDWATVTEIRKQDKASGTGDDSFGQGTKEDTPVPTVVSGSIPPNKSDLKYFGVFKEGSSIADGFLNLFWTRVQDPSGTTNMDFELNQSATISTNGITPVRTAGDLLITYDLTNGGTKATIGERTWDGTQWGPYTEFGGTDAVGTINASAISSGNADSLGALDPRTFGEASVRLSALFENTPGCVNFGKAYLKSRSSDSFTAAVKDFIAPVDINLTNCGTVTIVKKDDAGSPLAGAAFTLYPPNATNTGPGTPATSFTCTTSAAGTCSMSSIPFGTYWTVETTVPAGYEAAPDTQVAVSGATPTVTVTLTDPRQRGAIRVYKQAEQVGSPVAQSGVSFTVNGVTKATDANGYACFDNLLFGTYSVSETVPPNYVGEAPKSVTVDNKASCADATYVGEAVTFTNTPLSEMLVAFRPQVPGATDATISCVKGADAVAANNGTDTLSGWTRSKQYKDLLPGTYTCTVVIAD